MTTSEPAPAAWEIWHARFNFDDRDYKFRLVFVPQFRERRPGKKCAHTHFIGSKNNTATGNIFPQNNLERQKQRSL